MDRRESVLALVAIGAAAVSSRSHAQAQPVRRIGILLPNAAPALNGAFRKRLATLGWIEGQNLLIESLHAEGRNDRMAALATELVRRNVEVIVTSTTPGALAAKAATSTIPIVFAHVADPMRANVVASLARPDGNVTGVSSFAGEIVSKQFELLNELMPKLKRIAFMNDPSNPLGQRTLVALETGAEKYAVSMVKVEARTPEEIEPAFASAARERAGAILVVPTSLFMSNDKHIVALARKYKIATVHQNRQAVVDGALVSYGIDFVDAFARTAVYVDKILKGAKPGDLPVEQAERFVSAINRSTAKALGITIPQSVLVRVDEVIE